MASVRKRKWTHNGSEREAWVVSYTKPDGKRALKTFDKKKAADAFKTSVDGGQHVENQLTARAMTFGEALDLWIDEIEKRKHIGEISGNHRVSMLMAANRYVRPHLGALKLHDMHRDHVQAWLDRQIATYAKETVKHMLIPVHGALRLAVRKRLIARNPLIDDPIRVLDKPAAVRAIPTKEQIGHLLRFIAVRRPRQSARSWERVMLIFTLGLFQGMRIGEICGLQWSDVDFDRDAIRIKHSLSRYDGLKAPKTAAGVRTLPMSRPTRELLHGLANSAGYGLAEGFVFRRNDGRPIAPDLARKDTFYHVMRAAGFSEGRSRPFFNLHSLRHAALSLLAQQGIPPLHLKQLAGHKSVTTTMDIYGHLFPCDTADRLVMSTVADQFLIDVTPPQAIPTAPLTEDEARALTATQRHRLRQSGVSVPLLRSPTRQGCDKAA